MKQQCTLMEKYIRLIQNKTKIFEARVATEMFKKWREGDTVKFFSRRNPHIYVIVRITEISTYTTFREMLETLSPKLLIPGIESIDEAEKAYLKIPRYAEKEKLGVLAFKLEVIN